jgi:ribose transport system ATP-binding protein
LAEGTTAPVLEARRLSKWFGATHALNHASIDLAAGEVHVLLGENGAGKSTIAKIVAGLHVPDQGELWIRGRKAVLGSVQDASRHGIAVVFQELSLAPQLTVAENLFLGSEAPSHPFALLRRRQEREKAARVLQELQIDASLDAPVGLFSVGKKQLIEIAKALLRSPGILIMDEPTSSLTEREKQFLFGIVRKLQSKGTAILYVTHHLREVFEIGSRVSTMRDGRVMQTLPVGGTLTERDLLETLTGRRADAGTQRPARSAGALLLEIRDLHTGDGCRGVDLTVHGGEIVGVYGVVGSGREGVGRAVTGVTAPARGEMRLAGQPYRPRHPAHAARHGIRYLAMDRKAQGILPQRQIRENLTLCSLAAYARFGFIRDRLERAGASARLARLGVRYRSMESAMTSLSGGNQQKVLFGRACGTRPRLLVMEDPTAGVDIGAKAELHEQIRALAADGSAVLLLSSDLKETLSLCDRVYTAYRGRLTDEIRNPSPDDEERVLERVLGRGR